MASADSAGQLRIGLVAELRAKGVLRSEALATAFATVPRERFIPQVAAQKGLKAVYSDQAFVTKKNAGGLPLSSSSQPALMAKMLELLDVRTGQRVLEVGAGSGYNAALLARLVGSEGKVTSIDVDPELAAAARDALKGSGCRVSVVVGDGRRGWPAHAPYDRIIVTACADQVSHSWHEQLKPGGLLELPLRLDPDRAAIQVIPVFARDGERLRSRSLTWGGFMPLHHGDGGWRTLPATLSARRSGTADDTSLISISGSAVKTLPHSVAQELLAELLAGRSRPHATGFMAMSSAQPPMPLIYLMLRIPANRRLTLQSRDTFGVGLLHRASGSAAFVSARSPWMGGLDRQSSRTRWRLDGYRGEAAAVQLRSLLAEWQAMAKSGRQTLGITASGWPNAPRLRFRWVKA